MGEKANTVKWILATMAGAAIGGTTVYFLNKHVFNPLDEKKRKDAERLTEAEEPSQVQHNPGYVNPMHMQALSPVIPSFMPQFVTPIGPPMPYQPQPRYIETEAREVREELEEEADEHEKALAKIRERFENLDDDDY